MILLTVTLTAVIATLKTIQAGSAWNKILPWSVVFLTKSASAQDERPLFEGEAHDVDAELTRV